MFIRSIKVPSSSGAVHEYVRVVESVREHGRVKQRLVLNRDVGAAGHLPLTGLALAPTAAPPFTVTAPAALTLVKGYPLEVPVRFEVRYRLAVDATGLVVPIRSPEPELPIPAEARRWWAFAPGVLAGWPVRPWERGQILRDPRFAVLTHDHAFASWASG